jgi:FtsP/CotA-like multicopper oxidase with cupredoxin domain
MSITIMKRTFGVLGVVLMLLLLPGNVGAVIDGITGTAFNLAAKQCHVVTSDGDSVLAWGYANGTGEAQYPGPTLIVNQGQTITVTLVNHLPAQAGNVSIVFPGHNVVATGGAPGLLTQEAPPDGTTVVTYTFEVSRPGTYLYRSGTRPDLQAEMGLVGALIVRPSMGQNYAYGTPESRFDREYLFLLTEMDPRIHRAVEFGFWDQVDTSSYFATNWFINGRNFPDIIAEPNVPWMVSQPYNCLPRMLPGEKTLIRLIGAGRDIHPMHLHGNDFETIAINGTVLESAPGAGPDLAWKDNTIRVIPGQTADVVWSWTGEKLGWDIYGHMPHTCNPGPDGLDPVTKEYCEDHGVPFPVIIPDRSALTFGPYYSGSPFLGDVGELGPGDPGLNASGGYFYMWHSHTEKELTSNDIWPGGYVTFMIVEPPGTPIP